jgi:hypothetical protein
MQDDPGSLVSFCGTIPAQFRHFQIHFVKQRFASPGKVAV